MKANVCGLVFSIVSMVASVAGAQIAPPNNNLGSNANYIMGTNDVGGTCSTLQAVTVSMHVTEDLVAGPSSCGGVNGFSVQLNANGPTTIANTQDKWQQFVMIVGQNNVQAHTQPWTKVVTDGSRQSINNTIAPTPSPFAIPAGYTLTWKLATDSTSGPTFGNVTKVTYTVEDSQGTKTPLPQDLTKSPVTSGELAPIASFQLDIVGSPGCHTTFLSGAGTITYTVSPAITAHSSTQACAISSTTAETSNSGYGLLPSGSSKSFQQAFWVRAVGSNGHVASFARSDLKSTVAYENPSSDVATLTLSPTSWHFDNLTVDTGAPGPVSEVAAYVRSDNGTNAIVYRSADGHIHELSLLEGASTWQAGDLSSLTGATAAVGNPAAYVRSDGTNAVVYRGSDGHIHEISLEVGANIWTVNDLTSAASAPAASGDPVGFVRHDTVNAVVYQAASSGHIYELTLPLAGLAWGFDDLTAITGAPAEAGPARAYVRSDNYSSIVYRATDNDIHEIYLAPGSSTSWSTGDITATAGAPAASGDPAPYVRSDNTNSVVYSGSDGDVHELALPQGGAWSVYDLTALTGAPSVKGGVIGYVRADSVNAVNFQGSNNHIYELALSGNWSVNDLTAIAGGP
jgi:hypothetical protein